MKMPLPCCVYVLLSGKDHLLYFGYSSNLEKRIKDHDAGKTASTAHRAPLDLIFAASYIIILIFNHM